jgi:serine/threonine-protein kinase
MPLSPKTHLGRYQIISQLGAGGMGEVYLARDAQLDRAVALKTLPSDVAANGERMRRFVQEAKAAAALSHPNIAHIYEVGESEGTHFIAMEYVDGKTLREEIHREKAPLNKLLKYLVQVAEGLAKAHAAGIVHRDLKPDNVMITRDGYAKILDFGLAKLVEPQKGFGSDSGSGEVATAIMARHSTPGTVMGTIGYMSPEQAQGKVREIDHRSDIFSFGCILYEAATGRQAFEGKDVLDSLHQIVHAPTPQIKDVNSLAPDELQRVVRRCLAKEPDKRYQSIKDVAIELDEIRQGLQDRNELGPSVRPRQSGGASATSGAQTGGASTTELSEVRATSNAEYIATGIKRHKAAVGIVLVLLAAAITGIAYYLRARSAGVAIESVAVLPFENKSSDPETEYLSDGLTESLIYKLSQLPNLKVSPSSSVFRYKGKETDPVKVGNELGVSAVLSGKIKQRGNQLTISVELVGVRSNKLLWGEQYDRQMSDLLQTQREIAREIIDKLRVKVSGEEPVLDKHYTESNEAYQLYLRGRFYWNKRTGEAVKKAIEYFNQAIERDPRFALAYAGLADCYVVPANPLPPREKMPRARAAAMRALEIDETLAEAHTSLARVLTVYDWNWTGGEKEFKRAIELNPRYAVAHEWYGTYFEMMGRRDASIAERKRAQELDPLSLIINFELGTAYYYARDYDHAIEQFQKTLELDPNFPPVQGFLAGSYEQRGKYAEAISISDNEIVRGDTELSSSRAGLGHIYAVSGKKGEARAVLDELKQISQTQYVPADRIALIYAGLGENDEAFAWLEKAYEEHAFHMGWLKVEPRWDSLRSDPRFQELVRKVGLTP